MPSLKPLFLLITFLTTAVCFAQERWLDRLAKRTPILTWKCEQLLYHAGDRALWAAALPGYAPQRWYKHWERFTDEFLYGWPKPVDNVEDDNERRGRIVLAGEEHWNPVFRRTLQRLNLYAGEDPKKGFLLTRDRVIERNSFLARLDYPGEFSFYWNPVMMMAYGHGGMVHPGQKVLMLPAGSVFGSDSSERLALLHERIHVQLEQNREANGNVLFGQMLSAEPGLLKAISYMTNYTTRLTSEEIIAHLVTGLVALDKHCVHPTPESETAVRTLALTRDFLFDYTKVLLPKLLSQSSEPELGKSRASAPAYLLPGLEIIGSGIGNVSWNALRESWAQEQILFADLPGILLTRGELRYDMLCARREKLWRWLERAGISEAKYRVDPFNP